MSILMKNKFSGISKSEINKLNDMNQFLKKCYSIYFITREGLVFTKDKYFEMDLGKHFSFINDDSIMSVISSIYSEMDEDEILVINSRSLYEVVKCNKKSLSRLVVDQLNNIFICDCDEKIIGDEIGYVDKLINVENDLSNYASFLENLPEFNVLTDEEKEKILLTDFYLYERDEYKIRLTKSLSSHPKHIASIGFKDLGFNNLFQTIINVFNNKITNFHVYTCIKY